MKQILKKQYSYFYHKTFNKRKLDFTKKEDGYIESFYRLLKVEYGDSVGEQWLFEYLSYQFNKYADAETGMKVQLNWIYGKKALEKYRNRNKESEYFNDKFRKEHNISKGRLIDDSIISKLSEDYREAERNRFKEDKQVTHCLDFNLFDKDSKTCMFCKNNKYCRELWEVI